MTDPLSEVISLLRPRAVFAKGISAAGPWAVRYSAFGQPGFCAVLMGSCILAVDGYEPAELQAGDFVLLPATPAFSMSGAGGVPAGEIDPKTMPAPLDEVRHGRQDGPPEMRMLGGYFEFGAPDADLLVSLLPGMIHIRDIPRLATLVTQVGEEATAQRPGRDLVLTRLVEILLIEALRCAPGDTAPAGLLRGLADERLATALRYMHSAPSHGWTVAELASKAALSRSAFFDRFSRAVGLAPMEYLIAWRMALAKNLLRTQGIALADIAERVGYQSASAFSTAFSKYVGQPPGRFARGSLAVSAGA